MNTPMSNTYGSPGSSWVLSLLECSAGRGLFLCNQPPVGTPIQKGGHGPLGVSRRRSFSVCPRKEHNK